MGRMKAMCQDARFRFLKQLKIQIQCKNNHFYIVQYCVNLIRFFCDFTALYNLGNHCKEEKRWFGLHIWPNDMLFV